MLLNSTATIHGWNLQWLAVASMALQWHRYQAAVLRVLIFVGTNNIFPTISGSPYGSGQQCSMTAVDTGSTRALPMYQCVSAKQASLLCTDTAVASLGTEDPICSTFGMFGYIFMGHVGRMSPFLVVQHLVPLWQR